MAIVKYNPFKDLRTMQEEMNHLLDLAWNRESGEDLKEGIWQPPVDIYEDRDSVVIKAEVPDIDQKDIEVKIENNTLTLRGERKQNLEVKKENYHRVERYFGTFQRSFTLPHTIDQEKVEAVCDKGVLTVVLPKKEETKPKQIKVEVK
ncbi:Hsp20/alpha crystallin family protein [Geotalea uraniireducens]|uniref:Heat shock protein Hsp20 n=1 Tax=Geotalea uraniireducens (strain Rf4) TaxID=351605 RepID=A5G8D6_GEOUR|nr:Hsp20/alpha crystallin family protein [Geotalea uraniireducens]ABQ28054.1 heat shock protein Hsp20 [Geotalea uraniireducens Rf4]